MRAQKRRVQRRVDRAKARLRELLPLLVLGGVALAVTLGLGLAVWYGPRVQLFPEIVRYVWGPGTLTVPVEGLALEDIQSTWQAQRSDGRRHEGADLFARRGTPVVSSTRGTVWKVGWDRLGGRVVTVLGEGPAFYYYAHLQAFAPGLRVGDKVERGGGIGTVGTSGNARGTRPHLHFGVYRIGWTRVHPVDPVPLFGPERRRARKRDERASDAGAARAREARAAPGSPR